VHNDATGTPGNAVFAVIKCIGAFQSRAGAATEIWPDRLQGSGAVEKLYALLFTGFARCHDSQIAALLADLPEPYKDND